MNDRPAPESAEAPAAGEYQVLARKYRPSTFSGLIGQDAMVKTLTNAFASNRLHHAFVMTGVRGVGKTSTARIIARALNCIGPDGTGGPTTEPCGVCEHCIAIAGDRHVDVLEMDAASNTGVDNIRELIDGVRYRPASARYKVYIIDEVHMLSKSAFNALLKTLEEPPEHVIFIFATTEIRKVPITVLSRCQRFDLRRVPTELLVTHFASICKKEGAEISDGALHIIARAADGSVRDGLSLLDQAIAHADGAIGEDRVRDMLGLADRTRTFDLLECVLKGDIAPALTELQGQYKDGADPASVIEDMLDLVHWLTRIKVQPESADAPEVPENERTKGKEISATLRMPVLTRAWQILLKGLGEINVAPSPLAAAEMVLVRLAYAAELPTPGDAVKALQDEGVSGASQASSQTPSESPSGGNKAHAGGGGAAAERAPAAQPQADAAPQAVPRTEARAFPDFEAVAVLAGELREGLLQAFLENQVRIVTFQPGRIEFSADGNADRDMVQKLKSFLEEHSSMTWSLALARESNAPTIAEMRAEQAADARSKAGDHPLVKAVLDAFPGANVEEVRHVKPKVLSDAEPTDPDAAGEDDI
ncbi:DNA polymerase III subunit gamma/tau [Thalassospiraceae bacterium LMO-JJ14]|nr:DNA polymerase III subunit gamma/tau [Thalassospiraceae bacterium LMO-JJ14]